MSNPIDDGGPAFPSNDAHGCAYTGMTLRDYFAGQALGALIADGYPTSSAAKISYQAADWMIAKQKEDQP
jgi:hypothetical protein